MSESVQVLVVDDEPEVARLIASALEGENLNILSEENADAGFELFLKSRPKTVVIDADMNGMSGVMQLERILTVDPGTNVILTSDHYSVESAVVAIQRGACDYLTKPLDGAKVRERIAALRAEAEMRRKTLSLDEGLLEACKFEGIVSRSPLMQDVFAKIRRVAPHFKTALITGATGTGKELVAHALHNLSPAVNDRFVACNCSALVESLVESELFGYVRGAFTGANQDRPGLFESADGGTLFLDEIGELSLGMQAKLLRVLQDHRVRRVGSSTSRNVDLRVIAATNRNLETMVNSGTFREDLYYRLAMVEVNLPKLKDRREDLPLLQRHFIEKFAGEYSRPIAGLTRRAQSRMAVYSWPGNIRELENVIGNGCMMAHGRFIDLHDLPERLRETPKDYTRTDEALFSLQEAQRRHIARVLERVGGNKLRAARILGVGRNTIYKMLSRFKAEERDMTA